MIVGLWGLLRRRGRVLGWLLFGSDDDFESFLLMRGNGRDQDGDQEQRAEENCGFRRDFDRSATPRHENPLD